MKSFFRLLRWTIVLLLAVGVAALLVVMFWLPPNDADSFALVRERTARLSAYRLSKPLPGAVESNASLEMRLQQAGLKLGAPIFIRIYKLSFELEVWIEKDRQYQRFATYPICYFSGQLGPKVRFGDRQSPEGFYKVDSAHLNPFSAHHRAFNLGFPNAYDRVHARTGSLLEVHGGCSSVGCYAMTNPVIDDLYRLATAAIAAGQPSFQVEALPFRMTAEAMAARADHPLSAFWQELKSVADVFDDTHRPPDVLVCGGHYRAGPSFEAGCQRL